MASLIYPASSLGAVVFPKDGRIVNLYIEDSFADGRLEIVQSVTKNEIYFSCVYFGLSDLPMVENRIFLSNRDTAEKIREYYLSLETES